MRAYGLRLHCFANMSTAALGCVCLRSMFAKVYEDASDKSWTSQTSFEFCSNGVSNDVHCFAGPAIPKTDFGHSFSWARTQGVKFLKAGAREAGGLRV